MFRGLMAQAAADVGGLIYLLPYVEQDNLYASIRPTLMGSPDDPAVMSGLRQLSRNGEFSLSSLFAAGQRSPNAPTLSVATGDVPLDDPALRHRFFSLLDRTKALLQIGVNNEGEHTGGVNLEDILRPGSRGAAPIFNFGDLKALTRAYCPSDTLTALQFEGELTHWLDLAAQAAAHGNEGLKQRALDRYIGLLQKGSSRFVPAVQADALIGIARTL